MKNWRTTLAGLAIATGVAADAVQRALASGQAVSAKQLLLAAGVAVALWLAKDGHSVQNHQQP